MTEDASSFGLLEDEGDYTCLEDMPEMAQRLLAAGLELFARKGYAATSVREIVQQAHVTNPMLYYYFDSKQGLFHQLIRLMSGGMIAAIEEALAQEGTFVQRLERVGRAYLRGGEESPMSLAFMYGAFFGPRETRPAIPTYAFRVQMGTMLERLFEEAIASGEFVPHSGFTVSFLVEQFLGLLNQHMMRLLKCDEIVEVQPEVRGLMEELMNEMTLERSLEFFLRGAGDLLLDDHNHEDVA